MTNVILINSVKINFLKSHKGSSVETQDRNEMQDPLRSGSGENNGDLNSGISCASEKRYVDSGVTQMEEWVGHGDEFQVKDKELLKVILRFLYNMNTTL